MKRQETHWEKICTVHILNKGFMLILLDNTYINSAYKSIVKGQFKTKMGKIFEKTLVKENIQMVTSTQKA